MSDEQAPQLIRNAIRSADGSLSSGTYSEFFHYHGGSDTMCLDGDFTAAELRALADHIDKHKKQEAMA